LHIKIPEINICRALWKRLALPARRRMSRGENAAV